MFEPWSISTPAPRQNSSSVSLVSRTRVHVVITSLRTPNPAQKPAQETKGSGGWREGAHLLGPNIHGETYSWSGGLERLNLVSTWLDLIDSLCHVLFNESDCEFITRRWETMVEVFCVSWGGTSGQNGNSQHLLCSGMPRKMTALCAVLTSPPNN